MNKNIGPLKVLSSNEMIDVQALPTIEKQKYIIAGYVDFTCQTVILFRGDGFGLRVPFETFTPNAKCAPNFEELSIIDYGLTVKLGEYEASGHGLLIDYDPDYRSYCNLFNIKDIN